ncbi:MAG TPA: hypothetical protein VJ746_17315 [Nitrospira sp.]|nr:hypothetical protein [Nitrospira sp.]
MAGEFLSLELTIYGAAIAALLGLWLFHQAQVRAGRIQAVDLFDRSLARMYVYAAPCGTALCEVCAAAQGRVFLSQVVGRKGFSPLDGSCKEAGRCQGLLIGLYGSWLEARELMTRLQRTSKKTVTRLSDQELHALVKGEWAKSVSANTDRLGMRMLEGLCFEKHDSDAAIAGYRYVIERANEPRHLSLVVPAYLRIIAVLIGTNRDEEASESIKLFDCRFPVQQHEAHSPSPDQRKILEEAKSLLWKRLSLKVPA